MISRKKDSPLLWFWRVFLACRSRESISRPHHEKGEEFMIRSKKLWLIAPLVLASVLNAGNVVAAWNAIGSTTVVANAGKTPGQSTVWFAYSSLAMYDAVNAITGDYEPFYYRIAGPSNASIDAAAVAAAHRILVNYFPLQQTALNTQFTASLAGNS